LRAEEPLLERVLELAGPPLGNVSVVLATYNRCPFPPGERGGDNPLCWALDSLLAQAGAALAEIVVVDDASTDHTPHVLEHYARAGSQVPVRVIRLAAHGGSAVARNAGAEAARSQWLLYTDDDCVMPRLWVAGAAATFARLLTDDDRAAALMLPFYYRALQPSKVVEAAKVGRLDVEHARFSTSFHCWPDSHLDPVPRLAGSGGLLQPLRVQLVGGTLLLDRDALRQVGGWADQSEWATSYADQMTLSADLTDAGFTLYFSPDPRLGCPHLKWGAVGRYPTHDAEHGQAVPGSDRSLGELVSLARVPRTGTGCRTSAAHFFEEETGALFEFFVSRSRAGGRAWAQRTYTEFVQAGRVHSKAVAEVPDQRVRRRAWRRGLARGARAAEAAGATYVWAVLRQVTGALGEEPITPP
jgi:GT2 family glycosyltransferase